MGDGCRERCAPSFDGDQAASGERFGHVDGIAVVGGRVVTGVEYERRVRGIPGGVWRVKSTRSA